MRRSLVSYVYLIRLGFTFGFQPNGLDLFYDGNLFCQATLKGDFIILDLDDSYNSTSSSLFQILSLILNLLGSILDLVMWVKTE